MKIEGLREIIDAARGKRKSDILLKGGNIINVFTGEVASGDVAITGGLISGVAEKGQYNAETIINVKGKYIAPGFIDSHIHIESSMVTPSEFARAVLPRGTTTIIADPHEIANVLGIRGIRLMHEDAKRTPLDVRFVIPSCVPATDMETSGAKLTSKKLKSLIGEDWVLGLGEVMNFPGVLSKDREILEKIIMAKDANKIIDGHAPMLSGLDLSGYIAAGIGSDHESISLSEAKEKLGKGMFVMIREGSTAKNLEELLPLVNEKNFLFATFVADDIDPGDLMDRGHIDYFLKKAVSLGLDPIMAIRMVTISPAIHFGLSNIGAVSPGRTADIVVLDNFSDFSVNMVFKRGKMVARDGTPTFDRGKGSIKYPKSMNAKLPKRDAIRILWEKRKARVIKVIVGQIITDEINVELKEEGGYAISDTMSDILKVAVFERHRRTGNVGLGFISGFGLKEGAIASSVGHDSHNIIVVGTEDEDIYLSAKRIVEIGGGQLVVKKGKVISELPLPVAGIMSGRPLEEVESGIRDNLAAAKEIGCVLENPFMALSFLSLPVIPKLKITDRGLVDVTKFSLVPIYL